MSEFDINRKRLDVLRNEAHRSNLYRDENETTCYAIDSPPASVQLILSLAHRY